MRARITVDDLAAQTLVDPTWYPCEIIGYKEEPTTGGKNPGQSTNCIWYFKVVDAKVDKFKGARFRLLVNEQVMSKASGLLVALGAKVDKEKGLDVDMSEATMVGRFVDVHIRRGESDRGNPFNEPVEYAPIGTITKYVPAAKAVTA